MRKIVYTRPDGGMSVVHPAKNTSPVPEDITDAEAEQRAWDRLPPDAINPRFADESEIPPDRYFRNAWTDTGVITVDMPKALAIQQDKLRELRAPILADLDVQFMKALEVADVASQQAIVAKKNLLRNITVDPALTAAKTPDDLKQAGLATLATADVPVLVVDAQAVTKP